PVMNGVRVVLEGLHGALLDTTVAGGPFDKATRTGWKTNPAGTRIVYKNGNPSASNPILSMVLATTKRTPGLYKFTVRGKNGAWPATFNDIPLRLTLILDVTSTNT